MLATAVEPPKVDEFEEFEDESWSQFDNESDHAKYWTDDWDNEDPDFINQVRNVLASISSA